MRREGGLLGEERQGDEEGEAEGEASDEDERIEGRGRSDYNAQAEAEARLVKGNTVAIPYAIISDWPLDICSG
jgi:hypothetical protein